MINTLKLRWQALFLCLSVLLYSSLSAAQPTDEWLRKDASSQINQNTKSYIIKFKEGTAATRAQVETSLRAGTTNLQMSGLEANVKNKTAVVLTEMFTNSATKPAVKKTYVALFRGFSADLTVEQVNTIRKHPDVLEVFEAPVAKPLPPVPVSPEQKKKYEQMERNYQQRVQSLNRNGLKVTATTRNAESGLDALDGVIDGKFDSAYTGKGVNIYVMDSAIRYDHPTFSNRINSFCKWSFDQYPPAIINYEGTLFELRYSHGTHVAGIAAGDGKDGYGVAPGAKIIGLGFLDFEDLCPGQPPVFDGVANAEWILKDHLVKGKPPAVLNMSFGVKSDGLEKFESIVQTLRDNGIVAVNAAGNSNSDSCYPNPPNVNQPDLNPVRSAITVGAADLFSGNWFNTTKANFSNFGSCVDIWAPGAEIKSASSLLEPSSIKFSGTSMASPMVAGVAALILEQYPKYTPDQVWEEMKKRAKTGVLTGEIGKGSPNLFLQAVKKDNKIPSAKFVTSKLSGTAPLTVLFDASASSDPDGVIIAYDWVFLGENNFFDNSRGVKVSQTFEKPGVYYASLLVTDNQGAQSFVSLAVNVAKKQTCKAFINAVKYCQLASCATGFEGSLVYLETIFGERYKCKRSK